MSLSHESKTDFKWWVDALPLAFNFSNHGDPQIMMTTDASFTGWGCCFDTVTTGGNWTPEEAAHDINYLEMLAAFLALKSLEGTISGKHIKLMVNNTTAMTMINQIGTCHSGENNHLARQIWEWCISRNVWPTVVHIPGKENTEASKESRLSGRETVRTLQPSLFKAASHKLGVIRGIYLFASRLNYHLKPYVAYKPDLEAHAINAFHVLCC